MDSEAHIDESFTPLLDLSKDALICSEKLYPISSSPKRWLVALSIFLLNFANGWAYFNYTTIDGIIMQRYNASRNFENMLTQLFFIATTIFIFPAIYLIDKTGLRVSTIIVSSIQTLGITIKILGASPFIDTDIAKYFTLFGQMLFAIMCPIIIILPTKVASTCFEQKDRMLANSICTMGNFLGVLIVSSAVPASYDSYKSVFIVEIISAIPVYLGFMSSFIFLKKEFAEAIHAIDGNIKILIKKLIRNKQFLLLSFTFGILLGVYNVLLTNYRRILSYQNYSQIENSRVISISMGAGIVLSMIASKLIDKYGNGGIVSKMALIILCILFILQLLYELLEVCLVVAVLLNSIQVTFLCLLLPYLLNVGVKITSPITEATSSGFQWFMSQIMSLIFSIAVAVVFSHQFSKKSLFLPITIMVIPLVIICYLFVYYFEDDF